MKLIVAFFVILILVLVIFQVIVHEGRRSLKEQARAWLDESGMSDYSVVFDTGDAIGLDYSRERVAIVVDGEHAMFPFHEILSVEVAEDGTTVTKTSRGSQFAGAAIGAVAFGGAGAIIGGLSGGTSSQEKIGLASINIITSLPEIPFFQVKVFQSEPTRKGGFVYSTLTKEMMPWYGRLKAIVERRANDTFSETLSVPE